MSFFINIIFIEKVKHLALKCSLLKNYIKSNHLAKSKKNKSCYKVCDYESNMNFFCFIHSYYHCIFIKSIELHQFKKDQEKKSKKGDLSLSTLHSSLLESTKPTTDQTLLSSNEKKIKIAHNNPSQACKKRFTPRDK